MARVRTANVRKALENDRTLGTQCGMDNRTLAWVATYRNRPGIHELTLQAGADCNTPACDPMCATMTCDDVEMGTGVAVTPLAIAKNGSRRRSTLAGLRALSTTYSPRRGWATCLRCAASSSGIRHSFMRSIPLTTFRKSSLLWHAVCGGTIDAVQLLLDRGAEVKRHSGKLRTLAVMMNRVELVKLVNGPLHLREISSFSFSRRSGRLSFDKRVV